MYIPPELLSIHRIFNHRFRAFSSAVFFFWIYSEQTDLSSSGGPVSNQFRQQNGETKCGRLFGGRRDRGYKSFIYRQLGMMLALRPAGRVLLTVALVLPPDSSFFRRDQALQALLIQRAMGLESTTSSLGSCRLNRSYHPASLTGVPRDLRGVSVTGPGDVPSPGLQCARVMASAACALLHSRSRGFAWRPDGCSAAWTASVSLLRRPSGSTSHASTSKAKSGCCWANSAQEMAEFVAKSSVSGPQVPSLSDDCAPLSPVFKTGSFNHSDTLPIGDCRLSIGAGGALAVSAKQPRVSSSVARRRLVV